MMSKLTFVLVLLFAQGFTAQQVEIFKLKKYETAVFSDSLKENSGLTFFNGKLFTINDGGNTSEIFEIDPKSARIKNVWPTKQTNIDWEAIASDSLSLYAGDFGNNAGTRTDLKVYKFPADSLFSNAGRNAQTFSYFYPEQKDFAKRIINNDFDAEAMIFLHGKIHIFTKEWVSKRTTHYTLDPNAVDVQPAQIVESYNTGFVVTDAEYFHGNLYLIGYTKNTEVFLLIFEESRQGIFFENKPRKFYLGSSVSLGQIEGIAADESGVYISGEEFRHPLGKVKPRLYFVPHRSFK